MCTKRVKYVRTVNPKTKHANQPKHIPLTKIYKPKNATFLIVRH